MSASKIENDTLKIDVEKIQVTKKTPKIENIEEEPMVTEADNNLCKLLVVAEVLENQISSTEPVSLIGEHDNPIITQSETESAAEIQSTTSTYDSATQSQSDFKIQHNILMFESDHDDDSAKVEDSVWQDVQLNDDDDRIELDTSIQVDADNKSDLAISEPSNHFAFRMIFPYFIRILHAFNALMKKDKNSTPLKKLTGDGNDGASTSDNNVDGGLPNDREESNDNDDDYDDDVFQACYTSGEDNQTLPGHGSENECPYAFPERERNNSRPRDDRRTIDILALILAGEIVVIISCMIAFLYHTLQKNDS